MDIFEAIQTQRSIRNLKPDPVPDEMIRTILEAAIRAPSGGNRQPWHFIVLRDAETKRQLADIYRDCSDELLATSPFYRDALTNPEADPAAQRMIRSSRELVDRFADIPVFVIPLMHNDGGRLVWTSGASIYPAMQNLMLAARAIGLGSCPTTIHRYRHEEVRQLLGIPPQWDVAAIVPVGFPNGKFGAGPRRPLAEVSSLDRFGQPYLAM